MSKEEPTTTPIHDGASFTRVDALDLRERMSHRQGFRKGHKAAVDTLMQAAAAAWTNGHDKMAGALRETAQILSTAEDDAVKHEYGRELDGVDFDACREILLGED